MGQFDKVKVWNEELLRYLQQSIDHIEYLRAQSSIKEHAELERLFNLHSFCIIAALDIQVNSVHLQSFETKWNSWYCGRQLVLHVKEYMDEVHVLLGKVIGLNFLLAPEEISLLKDISKVLGKFRNTHASRLKTLRDTCVGHRDNDVVTFFKHITDVTSAEMIIWSNDLLDILNRIVQFFTIKIPELVAKFGK
jgi:hypothetical protein